MAWIDRLDKVALACTVFAAGCGPSTGDGETGASASGTGETGSTGPAETATSSTGGSTTRPGTSSPADTGSSSSSTGTEGLCGGELGDSRAAWETARDAAANSYAFVVPETLVLEDFCSGEVYLACSTRTSFLVEDGIIVARTFTATPTGDATADDCPESYEETDADLGSHEHGFMLITVDGVYDRCCDLVEDAGGYLTENSDDDYLPGDVFITFSTDGFLASCSTEYCDDCGCDGGPGIDLTDVSF